MLTRQGYKLQKSRTDGCIHVNGVFEGLNADNLGGYRLIDAHTNCIVAGERFDMDLEAVERWAAPNVLRLRQCLNEQSKEVRI